MLLYYVRHGDPIYDPDSLTELGLKQAEALKERLKSIKFSKIYASTSNRAILTGTPLSKELNIPIETLPWCNEGRVWNKYALPNDEGKRFWPSNIEKYRQLFNSKEIQELGDNWMMHPAFDGYDIVEGAKEMNRNVDEFMENLGFKHDRENHCYIKFKDAPEKVILFAHQGCSWAFLSALMDIPYPFYSTHFDIQHSGYSIIEFNEGQEKIFPCMIQNSNDSHLYEAGLPLKYNYRQEL